MNPNLIIPVGTQVVSRIEVKNKQNQAICPQGGVGVITHAPTDNSHVYKIRLTNDIEIVLKGKIKLKHAMHLIRLLLSGITILQEGFVPVRVDRYREELLAIRDGNLPWDEANKWRLDLHKKFDRSFSNTLLPERPNYERANTLLIEARRQMVEL